MPQAVPRNRPIAFAVFLVIAGALGLLAAFELAVEKVLTLADPTHVPSCNVGVLVTCGANLASDQGSAFGFPNPFIGLAAWPCVIVVGVALLAGARFARWFWILFNLGVAGALAFVVWLISVSIFLLGTLCPWCLLTWAVTIPTFVAVTSFTLREGVLGGGERTGRVGGALLRWTWVITLAAYAVVVVIAQIRLDAIPLVILELGQYFG